MDIEAEQIETDRYEVNPVGTYLRGKAPDMKSLLLTDRVDGVCAAGDGAHLDRDAL